MIYMVDITWKDTKNRIESGFFNNEIECLKTIVLNISENCQLKCPMCPRAHGYPNRDIFMPMNVVRIIRDRLCEINYKNIISISGNGEPTMNNNLIEILKLLSKDKYGNKTNYKLQVLSNFIKEDDELYLDILKYSDLYISLHKYHTGVYKKYFDERIKSLKGKYKGTNKIFVRNHDPESDECTGKFTNRGGWMNPDKELLKVPCYYPFYKIFIDYDGTYYQCADDWLRKSNKDKLNVFHTSIEDYFVKYLHSLKIELLTSGRKYIEACNTCSTNGIMMGDKEIEFFKHRYLEK